MAHSDFKHIPLSFRKCRQVAVGILLFLLAACRPAPYPQALRVADSLATACPDSAVALLRSLRTEMAEESKPVQMYYRLLCVKAQDKAYIPHTSDSTVQSVLHYYEKRKDRRHLPEAYYYAGRVAGDLGDAPQALDYFGKALEAMAGEELLPLRSKVLSQMGTLFYRQEMYPEALEKYRQSLACDSALGDSVGMAYDLRDIGAVYYSFGDASNALLHYLKAYKLCKLIPSKGILGSIENRIAGLYLAEQRLDSAKYFLQEALQEGDYMERPDICMTAGIYYQKLNRLDSAVWYYKEVLRHGSIYLKRIAYVNLAQIHFAQGQQDTAIQYMRKSMACSDSIRKMTNTESLRKVHELYNYQLREKENMQLRIDNASKTRNFICLVIIGSIILLVAAWYFHNRRKKWMARLQFLKNAKEEAYRKSEQCIHDNEEEIRRLKAALQDVEKDLSESQSSRKELEERIEVLVTINKQVELEQTQRQLEENLFLNTDIYQRFRQQLKLQSKKSRLTDADWEELRTQVDKYYDNFTQKLNGPYQLNDRELRVSLLVKTRFSCKEIGSLVNLSQSGVSSTRNRLYEKVFGKKGDAKKWDEYILSL